MDSVVALFETIMARLPSLEILSCVTLSSRPDIGLSLLATQTGIKTGISLNHMPRYQPREGGVVVSVDLLMTAVAGGWNWKKPSANLPFLEMSLSWVVNALPATRVSPFTGAVEHQVVCMEVEDKRRAPSSMWRRAIRHGEGSGLELGMEQSIYDWLMVRMCALIFCWEKEEEALMYIYRNTTENTKDMNSIHATRIACMSS